MKLIALRLLITVCSRVGLWAWKKEALLKLRESRRQALRDWNGERPLLEITD